MCKDFVPSRFEMAAVFCVFFAITINTLTDCHEIKNLLLVKRSTSFLTGTLFQIETKKLMSFCTLFRIRI